VGLATIVCPDCGRRRRPAAQLTVTGRRVCGDCWRRDGVAASTIASGASAGPTGVGDAVAVEGWLARLRKGGRRRRPEAASLEPDGTTPV